jgi:hypothetical protein
MTVQILDQYKNRTEYRLLKDFCDCQTVQINSLKNGVLVLPGVLLSKLEKQQLDLLNTWLEDNKNQLILTPSWTEMNLKEILYPSVDIKISRIEGNYQGISVDFIIKTTAKDVVFQQNGKKFGIHYRKNTGTGLITVVTLPLLDYKMIQLEDKLKCLFNSLLLAEDGKQESLIEVKDFVLDDIHIYLIILKGAGIDLNQSLSSIIHKYFGTLIDEEIAKRAYQDLVENQYISDNGLLRKSMMVVKERKLKSFINAVKQRGEKEDGWI